MMPPPSMYLAQDHSKHATMKLEAQCWDSAGDDSPLLGHHWGNASCLMGRQGTPPVISWY